LFTLRSRFSLFEWRWSKCSYLLRWLWCSLLLWWSLIKGETLGAFSRVRSLLRRSVIQTLFLDLCLENFETALCTTLRGNRTVLILVVKAWWEDISMSEWLMLLLDQIRKWWLALLFHLEGLSMLMHNVILVERYIIFELFILVTIAPVSIWVIILRDT
jgi:hypothetical protein